jgi:excisionase family DNA binding protein
MQYENSKPSWDDLPQMIKSLKEDVTKLTDKVDTLQQVQRNSEEPITTKELCKRMSITEQTVNTWRKEKKIPFLRINGVIRYDWNKILEVLGYE